MPLKPTDPWYVPLPDSRSDQPANRRYKRALALSAMRREVEILERRPELAARKADAIAYRKDCMARWPEYLDGKIAPPTGRKPQKD